MTDIKRVEILKKNSHLVKKKFLLRHWLNIHFLTFEINADQFRIFEL